MTPEARRLPSGAYLDRDAVDWAGPVLFEVDRPLARLHAGMHPGQVSARKITVHYPAADDALALVGPEAFLLLLHLLRHAQETPDGLLHPAGAEDIAAAVAAGPAGRHPGWGRKAVLRHLETLRGHGLTRYLIRPLGQRRNEYFYEIPTQVCRPGGPSGVPNADFAGTAVPAAAGPPGDIPVRDVPRRDVPKRDLAAASPLPAASAGPPGDVRGGRRPGHASPDQYVSVDDSQPDPREDDGAVAAVLAAARSLGWRGSAALGRLLADDPARALAWVAWLRATPDPARNDGDYLTSMLRRGGWPPGCPEGAVRAGIDRAGQAVLLDAAGRTWPPAAQPATTGQGAEGTEGTAGAPARWTPAGVADALRRAEDADRAGAQAAREAYLAGMSAAVAAGLARADAMHQAACAVLGPPEGTR